jgi:glycosyltransferase involved in cell wall biosynthesis
MLKVVSDNVIAESSKKLVTRSFVSIILPVRNQADHIARVVEEHWEALAAESNFDFEILLVVNGCTDNTEKICKGLSASFSNVRMLVCQEQGWGAALKYGIAMSDGATICYASSARAKSETLVAFINQSVAAPDLVITGHRLVKDSFARACGSRLYNFLAQLLFDLKVQDVNGNPKVFPRTYVPLLHMVNDDYMIDVEFSVLCRENNYPTRELSVAETPRFGGVSTTTLATALELYAKLFKMKLQRSFQKRNPSKVSHVE